MAQRGGAANEIDRILESKNIRLVYAHRIASSVISSACFVVV